MRIKTLLDAYNSKLKANPQIESFFTDSGMIAKFPQFDYGFFPVGSGILNENKSKFEEAEIEEGGIMILGNDFGTSSYVKDCKKDNKEKKSNPTISNLLKVGLQSDAAFFTNFFIGLRDDIAHPGTTNTNLIKARSQEYFDFCFSFFKNQLDYINPKIVVCLGTQVGKALSSNPIFSNFSLKKSGISNLYKGDIHSNYIVNTDDAFFGKRKFILIPHPSYAHINWGKNEIEQKIKNALAS